MNWRTERGDEIGCRNGRELSFRRMHYYMRISMLVLLITDVTIYVDQCRYSENNGRSTGHDTVGLSWNLKVHYRVEKNTRTTWLLLLKLRSFYRFRLLADFIMQSDKWYASSPSVVFPVN